MASVNKAIVIGHLGRDPEVRYMPSGDAVTSISVATTETWKDKAGEKQEQTEWHRVTMFGKVAEIAGEYLKKGSLVYIEGRLQTKKWTDKEGQERYTTEIRCDRMQMLGSKSGGSSSESTDAPATGGTKAGDYKTQSGGSTRRPPPQGKGGSFDDLEDDIPFMNPYRGFVCYVV